MNILKINEQINDQIANTQFMYMSWIWNPCDPINMHIVLLCFVLLYCLVLFCFVVLLLYFESYTFHISHKILQDSLTDMQTITIFWINYLLRQSVYGIYCWIIMVTNNCAARSNLIQFNSECKLASTILCAMTIRYISCNHPSHSYPQM